MSGAISALGAVSRAPRVSAPRPGGAVRARPSPPGGSRGGDASSIAALPEDADIASSSSPSSSSSSSSRASAPRRVPRREAMTLAVAALAAVPTRGAAAEPDEAAIDAPTPVAPPPSPSDDDAPGASSSSSSPPRTLSVGDVVLTRVADDVSGYSLLVPVGWARDQPMANTPEFHPPGEYGGRRFRVTVQPVGRVPGGGRSLAALADSALEEVASAGFESPEAFARAEAGKFAPVAGTPGVKSGPGNATSEILSATKSDDGRYYSFQYRVENSIYPLRFWGVAAIGPGQVGGARKLGRRDVVMVTCQMPEDKAAPEDYELLEAVQASLRVEDF